MNQSRRFLRTGGFTLVELIVSMTVLGILLLLLTQLTSALRAAITQTTAGLQEFRAARSAFETMTRRLGQATLNAYDDLNPVLATASTANAAYSRASELRFVSGDAGSLILSGTNDPYPNPKTTYPYTSTSSTTSAAYPTDAIFFQAPLGFSQAAPAATPAPNGLVQLLNTCGYYIQWSSDANLRPTFLPSSIPLRYRFRLMELIQPTENLSIYTYTSGPSSSDAAASNSWYYFGWDWFQTPLTSGNPPVHVLAEDVIFLALLPMVAPQNAQFPPGGDTDGTSTDIAPNYYYDSSPPLRKYQPQYPLASEQSAMVAPYPQNQLPPLVKVVMIAVDDVSFSRYQAENGAAAPNDLGLSISTANPLTGNPILTYSDYKSRSADITYVTNILTQKKIAYRVFSAAVSLSRN
jgi:uncharacterized protein (TIGR02599 family)